MATIKSVSNFDGTPVYDYVGNSEETKPEGANVGENSTFTELDTGRQFFKKGAAWANMTAPGGGSSGGGLPINFPTESAANANKLIGFDANGNYTAKEGGGQFVVTFSDVDVEEGTIGSADKTYAQVLAAVATGQNVVASLSGTGFLIPIAQAINGVPIKFSNATHTDVNLLAVVTLASDESTSISIRFLASESFATSEAINVYNQLAPLIVNLTMDTSGENPAIVGNKTFRQIADAKLAGKSVLFNYLSSEGSCFFSMLECTDDGNEIMVCICVDGTLVKSRGDGSSFFRLNL